VSAPYQRYTRDSSGNILNLDGSVVSLDRDLDPASAINFFNVPSKHA